MAREFDLNVEKVLENWTVAHAIREIIANALDEQKLTGSEDIEIYKDHAGRWHVRDYGRGAQKELDYLESVDEELKKAETEQDLAEIGDELFEQGYIKRPKDAKKKKKETQKPMEFVSPDGFRVLVGKNNKQNDLLTLKLAKNSDMWFHTKDIHGSHTVLCYEHGREFSDTAILFAARLAAKYSKASESSQVPVDYTLIKYVKKPSGAAPGMVIYTDNKTVYVTPEK